MNRLCIGTGWCSNRFTAEKHSGRSRLCLQANWLQDYWRPQIEKYVQPAAYYCYISLCDIMPDLKGWLNLEFNIGHYEVTKQDPRHDFHCSLIMGAQYAFCQGMNFVYIEQDCMVKGLRDALAWAKDVKLAYGFGPLTSYSPGWAEQSFVWVRNDYLAAFIHRLNYHRFHESMATIPEIKFQHVFQDDAAFWPFGYGRKLQMIDWSLPVFYVQQLRDEDINKFMKNINNT